MNTGLAGSGAGSGLGLLSLLLALRSGLLLLGVLDGLLASGGTSLGALASSLLDHIKGSTDDSTLGLDDTAGTLLGDFLFNPSVYIRIHRLVVVVNAQKRDDPMANQSCDVHLPQSHLIPPTPKYDKTRISNGGILTSEIPLRC